jgi:predicted nucleic acid-binding protein
MGMKLKSGDIIFLDTAPFIYFFETHSDFFPVLDNLFNQLYETDAQVITSIITYIELTTQPVIKRNRKLVRKYRSYLSNSQNIALLPLDINIADHVVELRTKYDVTTPSAIQLGTAMACGADYIITNDKTWKRFKEVNVVLVGDI